MTRTGRDRIWTIPNVISFIRLAFVPVFYWLLVTGQDGPALAVLIIILLVRPQGILGRKERLG